MKPKEKAKELYSKYTDALNIRDLQITANPFAKQCALIAVDELIKSNSITGMYDQDFFDSEINYWNNVKNEIQKL